jgi:hypothetical protein
MPSRTVQFCFQTDKGQHETARGRIAVGADLPAARAAHSNAGVARRQAASLFAFDLRAYDLSRALNILGG